MSEIYNPNWDTLKKTITILNEDNSIYAEYDYIDWLQFRVELLQRERLQKQKFYVRNEHGGRCEIDKYGIVKLYDNFSIVNELLRKLILLQIDMRQSEELIKNKNK